MTSISRDSSRTDVDIATVLARRVSILGSTGTVGVATLDVIRAARAQFGADVFPVEALTAQQNITRLVEQALEFRPRAVVIGDSDFKIDLESALGGSGIEVMAGVDAIVEAA